MICLKIKNYDAQDLGNLSHVLKLAHHTLVKEQCTKVCEHCPVYTVCRDLSQARFYLAKKIDEL